jgi:hypothetical protein
LDNRMLQNNWLIYVTFLPFSDILVG